MSKNNSTKKSEDQEENFPIESAQVMPEVKSEKKESKNDSFLGLLKNTIKDIAHAIFDMPQQNQSRGRKNSDQQKNELQETDVSKIIDENPNLKKKVTEEGKNLRNGINPSINSNQFINGPHHTPNAKEEEKGGKQIS